MRAGLVLLLLSLAAGVAAADLGYTFGGWVNDLQAQPVAGAAVEVRNATTGAVVAGAASDGRGWWQVSQGDLFKTPGWLLEAAVTAEGATVTLPFATQGAWSINVGTAVLPIHPPPTPPPPAARADTGGGGCCPARPVSPGRPAVFVFPPGEPLEKVEIVSDEPGEVRLSLLALPAPPPGTPPAPGPVFRYLDLSITGVARVQSVSAEFVVDRTWLGRNSVPEDRVALARLEKEKWTPYPAKKIGETPAEVQFRARLPGLSLLAITVMPPPSPPPAPPSPSPAPPPPLEGFSFGVPDFLQPLARPLPLALLAGALGLVGAGVYLWRWAGRRS